MFGSWELCINVQNNIFKMAVCKYNKKTKKIEVSRALRVEIPEEFGVTKDIRGSAAVGLIRNALKENKINFKSYNLCISDRDMITRVIKLPKMDLKDLKSFMKLSIHQYFPIQSDEYCFDFKIQDINEKDEKAYFGLFLVAVPKATIDYYSNILYKCGLRPKLISIYSDVVSDLFINLVKKDIVIVDMGYSHTEFIVLEGKNIFINSIMNYSLPKVKGSISEDHYLKSLTEEQLGEDFITVCNNFENYINFFASRHHGKTIEEIYFIGEGAMLKDSIEMLEKSFNIKIKTGSELFKEKVIIDKMPAAMREQFYPERFCGCFGLLSGGMS